MEYSGRARGHTVAGLGVTQDVEVQWRDYSCSAGSTALTEAGGTESQYPRTECLDREQPLQRKEDRGGGDTVGRAVRDGSDKTQYPFLVASFRLVLPLQPLHSPSVAQMTSIRPALKSASAFSRCCCERSPVRAARRTPPGTGVAASSRASSLRSVKTSTLRRPPVASPPSSSAVRQALETTAANAASRPFPFSEHI